MLLFGVIITLTYDNPEMNEKIMTSQKLAYFASLSETLNFTRTAEQFYITQTAITQQIRAIEAELGVTLVDRSNKKIRLTPAGEVFAVECRRLLRELETAANRVKLSEKGQSGTLSIHCQRIYTVPKLPLILRHFLDQHPGVELEISSEPLTPAKLFQRAQFDLIFLLDNGFAFPSEYNRVVLHECQYYIAVPPQHRLARRTTVRLEDLRGEVLINNGSHEAQRALIQRDMVGAGHDVGHIIQADGLESTLLLCSIGRGLCILADYIIPSLPLSLNLIYIPLEKGEINAPIVALYPEKNTNPLIHEVLHTFHTFTEYAG